jgi:tripartite-type tricarboxylate transporter receptor subunit TctC
MISSYKKVLGQIVFMMIMLPAFLLGHLPSSLHAQDAASFYKGKVVSFVVGFSPGGGVDVSSRLMANTMGKYGNCSVVVRNMPGAGGILGLNHVYTADPDGLTVMIAPLGLTEVAQLLKSPGVKYDCRRFNWLGRFNTEPQVLVTGINSPYKSLDDVRKAKTVFSTGAEPTARASLAILIAAEALGLDNLKVIYGYPGSAEQILALIRGEADLYSPSLGTYLRQKKELRPLLVIERKRVADIPDVPALGELSIKKESKDLVEAFLNIWDIGLSVITTPGVPPERVRFLREILAKSLQDKELLAKAAKLDISLNPLPGDQVEKLVKNALGLSPEDLKKLDSIISVKYKK